MLLQPNCSASNLLSQLEQVSHIFVRFKSAENSEVEVLSWLQWHQDIYAVLFVGFFVGNLKMQISVVYVLKLV